MSADHGWVRQLYGSSGAALIAPVTFLGAVVILSFAGFGPLGDIGQAFSGPSQPRVIASPISATHGLAQSAGPLTLPLLPATAAPTTGGGPGTAPGASGPGPGNGASSGFGPGAGGTGQGTGTVVPSGSGGYSGGSGPAPPGGGAPTVIDTAVGLGTSFTKQLPGPVGPVTTQTLQSVGSTLDGIVRAPEGKG